MAKRCIGIDIGSSFLRAAQVAVTPEGFRVEKVFGTATRRASDSMPDILRGLFSRHGFDRHIIIHRRGCYMPILGVWGYGLQFNARPVQ